MVPVPVPTPYLDHKKHSKLFYKENVYDVKQIYCKMRMKILYNNNKLRLFIFA